MQGPGSDAPLDPTRVTAKEKKRRRSSLILRKKTAREKRRHRVSFGGAHVHVFDGDEHTAQLERPSQVLPLNDATNSTNSNSNGNSDSSSNDNAEDHTDVATKKHEKGDAEEEVPSMATLLNESTGFSDMPAEDGSGLAGLLDEPSVDVRRLMRGSSSGATSPGAHDGVAMDLDMDMDLDMSMDMDMGLGGLNVDFNNVEPLPITTIGLHSPNAPARTLPTTAGAPELAQDPQLSLEVAIDQPAKKELRELTSEADDFLDRSSFLEGIGDPRLDALLEPTVSQDQTQASRSSWRQPQQQQSQQQQHQQQPQQQQQQQQPQQQQQQQQPQQQQPQQQKQQQPQQQQQQQKQQQQQLQLQEETPEEPRGGHEVVMIADMVDGDSSRSDLRQQHEQAMQMVDDSVLSTRERRRRRKSLATFGRPSPVKEVSEDTHDNMENDANVADVDVSTEDTLHDTLVSYLEQANDGKAESNTDNDNSNNTNNNNNNNNNNNGGTEDPTIECDTLLSCFPDLPETRRISGVSIDRTPGAQGRTQALTPQQGSDDDQLVDAVPPSTLEERLTRVYFDTFDLNSLRTRAPQLERQAQQVQQQVRQLVRTARVASPLRRFVQSPEAAPVLQRLARVTAQHANWEWRRVSVQQLQAMTQRLSHVCAQLEGDRAALRARVQEARQRLQQLEHTARALQQQQAQAESTRILDDARRAADASEEAAAQAEAEGRQLREQLRRLRQQRRGHLREASALQHVSGWATQHTVRHRTVTGFTATLANLFRFVVSFVHSDDIEDVAAADDNNNSNNNDDDNSGNSDEEDEQHSDSVSSQQQQQQRQRQQQQQQQQQHDDTSSDNSSGGGSDKVVKFSVGAPSMDQQRMLRRQERQRRRTRRLTRNLTRRLTRKLSRKSMAAAIAASQEKEEEPQTKHSATDGEQHRQQREERTSDLQRPVRLQFQLLAQDPEQGRLLHAFLREARIDVAAAVRGVTTLRQARRLMRRLSRPLLRAKRLADDVDFVRRHALVNLLAQKTPPTLRVLLRTRHALTHSVVASLNLPLVLRFSELHKPECHAWDRYCEDLARRVVDACADFCKQSAANTTQPFSVLRLLLHVDDAVPDVAAFAPEFYYSGQ
ncbi:MAG: hypothetical protein MHM6MM_006035 [Cercozoa sp. M6MM]